MGAKAEKTMTAFFANKVRKALHKKLKGIQIVGCRMMF